VFSFGNGNFGQLGTGFKLNLKRNDPEKVEGLHPVTEISCGWNHSVVSTVGGQLWAWGRNQFGQLGVGHYENAYVPTLVLLPPFTLSQQFCCGSEHTVALTSTS
jgi:alpha-tubulin suppressor-like RCC1 family protein